MYFTSSEKQFRTFLGERSSYCDIIFRITLLYLDLLKVRLLKKN